MTGFAFSGSRDMGGALAFGCGAVMANSAGSVCLFVIKRCTGFEVAGSAMTSLTFTDRY